jgi:SAM-dependent methyltransferase
MERLNIIVRKNGFTLLERNGLYFVRPFPSIPQIHTVYQKGYFTGKSPSGYRKNVLADGIRQIKRSEKRLERISRYKTCGSLLDVGCGPGFFLSVARRNFSVTGIDFSEDAAKYAGSRFGLDVTCWDFESMHLPFDHFDVITMFSFLEHFPRPSEALNRAFRALRGGGLLVVAVPNIQGLLRYILGKAWRGFSFPEHLFFFTKKHMWELLNRAGFGAIESPWLENNPFRDTVYYYARK